MIEIDGPQALSLLQQAVALQGPGFIYTRSTSPKDPELVAGCWYERNGTPDCGVGTALHIAGVPIPVLAKMDQPEDSSIGYVDRILADNGVHLSPEALATFATFQTHQDLGTPWGDALVLAAVAAEEAGA